MTEFLDANVQAALMTQLTVPDLGFPIAFTFVPFSPVDGTPFLQVWPIMKAKVTHPGLGYSDSDLNRGIFQVDAVIPDETGEPPGLRMAAQIAERFAIGTTLLAGSRKVQINSVPQTAAAIKEGAWVRFPVTITYTLIS
jgi:Bacteriophage related domain of unknown function